MAQSDEDLRVLRQSRSKTSRELAKGFYKVGAQTKIARKAICCKESKNRVRTKIRLTSNAKDDTKFELSVTSGNGKRQRFYRDTRKEIEELRDMLTAQYDIGGVIWTTMNKREHAEILMTIGECKEMGVSLRDVMTHYRLTAKSKTAGAGITLQRMVEETLATARVRKRAYNYIDHLTYTLGKFIQGRETLPIIRIGITEIESFFAAQTGNGPNHEAAPATIQGMRSRIATMFTEAVRRGYISEQENPMPRVVTPEVTIGAPVYFKPAEAADLLWVCRQTDPAFLAWLVLGLFAGVRPEELEKLKWSDVDLTRGHIVINLPKGGGRYRRVVPFEPMLLEWMKEARAYQDPDPDVRPFIVPVEGDRSERWVIKRVRQVIKRHRMSMIERAGLKWGTDILRKTAATYLMALYNEEQKVSARLGNSPKILHRHYLGLGTREESDDFWNLTTTKVKNDPIPLPKGGYGKKKPAKLIP